MSSSPVRLHEHAEQRREAPVDDDDGGQEQRDGRERDVKVALRQRDPVPPDDAVVLAALVVFPRVQERREERRERRGARHERARD